VNEYSFKYNRGGASLEEEEKNHRKKEKISHRQPSQYSAEKVTMEHG